MGIFDRENIDLMKLNEDEREQSNYLRLKLVVYMAIGVLLAITLLWTLQTFSDEINEFFKWILKQIWL